jgi:hypothetical protein
MFAGAKLPHPTKAKGETQTRNGQNNQIMRNIIMRHQSRTRAVRPRSHRARPQGAQFAYSCKKAA